MCDAPIYRLRPQPGGPFCVPAAPNNREEPQAREPSKCLNGQNKEKDWPKRPSDCQLPEAQKKRLWLGHNSCGGGNPCPYTFDASSVLATQAGAPPSCLTLTWAELPQTKKSLCLCMRGLFSSAQLFATLWTVACQASLSGGFSRQEYWKVLVHTGFHTLLEHYISCCPSHQLPERLACQNPCNPSSCSTSTPDPHWGITKSSRAASGANSRGQTTCRGGNKTRIKIQGQCG